MEDWKIGILVVMCVIAFTLSVIAILYIIAVVGLRHKWGMFYTQKNHSNPLTCSHDSNVKGYTEGSHALYFMNFESQVCSLDLKKYKHVRDGAALRQLIAKMCHLDYPETLSLAYSGPSVLAVNTGSESLVPADLDLLIAHDGEFANRMSYTKDHPLVLHRWTTPCYNGVICNGRDGNTLCNLSHELQPHGISVDANSLLKLENNEGGAQNLSPGHYDYDPQSFRMKTSPNFRERSYRSNSQLTNALKPRIYPSITSHITDETPVFILAANYYIFYSDKKSELICDEDTTTALEAAMCGENGSLLITMSSGPYQDGTFLVNPNDGVAVLRRFGMTDAKVIRSAVKTIQYCVNPPADAQWIEFKRPIFLPPGRWCVQAKASISHEKFSATTARVYTVGVSR